MARSASCVYRHNFMLNFTTRDDGRVWWNYWTHPGHLPRDWMPTGGFFPRLSGRGDRPQAR